MASKKGKSKKGKSKSTATGECNFNVGDRVQVISGKLMNEKGYVRFVGLIEGKGKTFFVGVELDEARGTHDGEVQTGVMKTRFFKTAENHGYMAPFTKFAHFEANAIANNWNDTVSLIASYWMRSECKMDLDKEESELLDGTIMDLIVSYGQLLRYQNVYGCGNNEYGEFGFGKIGDKKMKFTKMKKVTDIERVYAIDGAFFLVRGDEKNNHILAAGHNEWSQLGLGPGNANCVTKFSKIKKFKNVSFVSKGLNATHTLFVMKDHKIYGCGNNMMGQLGIQHLGDIKLEKPKAMPLKKTPFLKDIVVDIKCGLMHSLFLTESGSVFGVGGNEDAQLGLGKKCMDQEVEKVTKIKMKGQVAAIECGMNCSFALTVDGKVFSWGSNSDISLGINSKMDQTKIVHKPTEVSYFSENGIFVEYIVTGAKHVLVRDKEHRVFAWGANKLGQCGIGDHKPEFVRIPQRIKMDESVNVIDWRMGSFHCFVQSDERRWYAFGSNAFRQCILKGEGMDERVETPTLIDESRLPKECDTKDFELVCGRETTILMF